MAYILQGVTGLGDDAKKAQLKAARDAAIVKQGGTPPPPGGGMGVGDDGGDGKIFGMPPVVVAAGAAILGYVGIRFVQKKRG